MTVVYTYSLQALRATRRGRTQIAAGSKTVLGIGPGEGIDYSCRDNISTDGHKFLATAPVELINRVTGKLRLL